MIQTVAHFIRKSSQLRASFIYNQIKSHVNYRPVVIYRYEMHEEDGGFVESGERGLPILNLSKDKKLKINYRFLLKISRNDVRTVTRYLDEKNVSVLHFHYGTDAAIYSDVIRTCHRPSVASFYGYDSSSFRTWLMGAGGYLLRKRLFPYVTKVLAMSPDMKNDLIRLRCPEDKIIVHYYGSDVKRFCIRRNNVKSSGTTNFLIISGIEPQKGHRFLLDAFREAYKSNSNIRLRIFGAGTIESEVRELICRNNMSSYVSMYGKVAYGSKEHLDELRRADVFIHPSVTPKNGDKEGIPGAVVEAMAAGLPVISTFHAGIPYILENRITGVLVNEWDTPSLTSAILELASDVPMRRKLGGSAQSHATQHLDIQAKEKELEEIYTSLLVSA